MTRIRATPATRATRAGRGHAFRWSLLLRLGLQLMLAAWLVTPLCAWPGSVDLAPLFRALDAYRLTDLRKLLAALPESADRSYFDGKLAVAEYRYDDGQRFAARCTQQAHSDAERSRCAELDSEALALAIGISSDNFARLRMVNHLRTRLNEAATSDPRNIRAAQLLARFYRVVPWYLGGGSAAATRAIRTAAAITPALAEELRGIDAFDARDWSGAINALQRVTDRDPQRAVAAYYLSLAYEKRGKRLLAVRVLKTLVTGHPEFWDAQFQLGTLSIDSEPAFAVQVLTHFCGSATAAGAKRLANAWWGIGAAEERLTHRDAALHAYRTALQFKPGHNESRDALARLTARS